MTVALQIVLWLPIVAVVSIIAVKSGFPILILAWRTSKRKMR
jgi:hypothetical protein